MPKELEPERKPVDTGADVYGDKGVIMYGSHGAGGVRIIPETAMKAYKRPEQKIPRVKDHHDDWLQAIRDGSKAGSDFSYGGPLTEIAMLGVIAMKLPGTKLEWDAPQHALHQLRRGQPARQSAVSAGLEPVSKPHIHSWKYGRIIGHVCLVRQRTHVPFLIGPYSPDY